MFAAAAHRRRLPEEDIRQYAKAILCGCLSATVLLGTAGALTGAVINYLAGSFLPYSAAMFFGGFLGAAVGAHLQLESAGREVAAGGGVPYHNIRHAQ